ncbi:phage portal protein, partial [Roseivivax isoporae]
MGILDMFQRGGMRAAGIADRDASDDRFFAVGGARSEIGVTVTVERARQVPVVRSCLKVLADSVAGLQFGAFQRLDDERVRRVADHPAAMLLANPNPRQTGFDFVYSIVDDLEAYGDFFAEVVLDRAT